MDWQTAGGVPGRESEMTESEKLQTQVRMLEAQLRDKEMEIELLKKVKELEGGVWWEK